MIDIILAALVVFALVLLYLHFSGCEEYTGTKFLVDSSGNISCANKSGRWSDIRSLLTQDLPFYTTVVNWYNKQPGTTSVSSLSVKGDPGDLGEATIAYIKHLHPSLSAATDATIRRYYPQTMLGAYVAGSGNAMSLPNCSFQTNTLPTATETEWNDMMKDWGATMQPQILP